MLPVALPSLRLLLMLTVSTDIMLDTVMPTDTTDMPSDMPTMDILARGYLMLSPLLMRPMTMLMVMDQGSRSTPSGLRKSAQFPRRSTLPSLGVPRSQGNSVPQLVVDSSRELRSVMIKPRPLSRMPLRNSVLLSPSVPASMSPNLCPSLLLLRSVLMSPRRSAPGQEPTQGRSRSQLSRNGAMCPLKNLDLPKVMLLFQTTNNPT